MAAADILLVTDGEIPDPPVPNEVFDALEYLKLRKGVEIHGLLVGKLESLPLSRICNKVHNFLHKYDLETILSDGQLIPENNQISLMAITSEKRESLGIGWNRQLSRSNPSMPHRTTRLFGRARYYDDDENENDWTESRMTSKKKRKGHRRHGGTEQASTDDAVDDAFLQSVETALLSVRAKVDDVVAAKAWSPTLLEKEREAEGTCWKYKSEITAAIDRVQEGLVERSEEARLVVLAMLSHEHILLLGVPGTGKSILGRRLSQLCNGMFFQRLLTKFTTPEELFGPLSLTSLEKDEYRRVTKGYLPQASVAFLDEIFKASSSILNSLLGILNERKFDNAGGQDECPIRCMVGASNELPDSDELDALFDRFLIRKEVNPVSDEGLFELLSMPQPGSSSCDTDMENMIPLVASHGGPNGKGDCDIIFSDGLDEVVKALSVKADRIKISQDVLHVIRDLRAFVKNELNVETSDRRLVKASRLLKITAASDGRGRVGLVDCMLLQHCLWRNPEQQASLRDWLFENLIPENSSKQFRFLLNSLRDEVQLTLRATSGDVSGDSGGRAQDIALIRSLREEALQLASVLEQKWSDISRFREVLEQANHPFLEPDEQLSMKQLLVPRAETSAIGFKTALRDALSLAEALSENGFVPTECRIHLIERLWDNDLATEVTFSETELSMPMKEAKAKYDLETFRKWKRARKKLQIAE